MAKRRILIIDDDVQLLGLLASLLEDAGCEVETIAGAEGFTPQLMTLGKPALVLISPTLQNLPRNVLKAVIDEFKHSSRRPVLLVADMAEEQLAMYVRELAADGYIPVRALLRDPVSRILQAAPPPPPPPPPQPVGPSIHKLAPDDILGIDLGPLQARPAVKPPSARPAAPRPPPDPARSKLAGQLLSAIEQEVATLDLVEGIEHFDVTMDVMSEANLYVDHLGMVAGVFIASSICPDEGTTVHLSITFPWGATLEVEGVVEWTRGVSSLGRRMRSGFGVRLPDLTLAQQAVLQRFMKLRAPMQLGGR